MNPVVCKIVQFKKECKIYHQCFDISLLYRAKDTSFSPVEPKMFSKTLLANKTHQILLVRKGFFESFRFPRFFQVLTQTSKITIKNYQNRWKERLKICKLTKFKGDSPKRVKILLQEVEKVKNVWLAAHFKKAKPPHSRVSTFESWA